MSKPRPKVAIIWSPEMAGAVRVRDRLRLQGWHARIKDASEWHRAPRPTPASVLCFVACKNESEILGAYEKVGWKGEVFRYGLGGEPFREHPQPPNAIAPSVESEPDALKVRLEAMDEAQLREFATNVGIMDLPSDVGQAELAAVIETRVRAPV